MATIGRLRFEENQRSSEGRVVSSAFNAFARGGDRLDRIYSRVSSIYTAFE